MTPLAKIRSQRLAQLRDLDAQLRSAQYELSRMNDELHSHPDKASGGGGERERAWKKAKAQIMAERARTLQDLNRIMGGREVILEQLASDPISTVNLSALIDRLVTIETRMSDDPEDARMKLASFIDWLEEDESRIHSLSD